MTIREATSEDEPEVLALARLFLETTSYRSCRPLTPELELAGLRNLFGAVRLHGVCLVDARYITDRRTVLDGFIALVLIPDLFNVVLEAEEVAWFVRPDRRGTPTARTLWDAAEEWARQVGAAAIKMVAPADEPAVGRLYRRRGYVAVETAYHKRL